jgi:hypothetical protein
VFSDEEIGRRLEEAEGGHPDAFELELQYMKRLSGGRSSLDEIYEQHMAAKAAVR